VSIPFMLGRQGIARSMWRLLARYGEPVAHSSLGEQDLGVMQIALDPAAQSKHT
jgi:hypothetical protein